MVAFAFSCVGILLFLWLSFGGPVPLRSEAYRFKVAVPEATSLAVESDVRISGVNVGKVKSKELSTGGRAGPCWRWRSSRATRRCRATCAPSCARRRCSARPTWR